MVATRAVAHDVAPVTLAFLRYLIGLGVLALPVLQASRSRRGARFAPKDIGAIAGLGVLQFALLIVLLNYALQTLPAATCALIFSTMPLVTMCLAIALGREVFSLGRAIGLLLAVSGVALLLGFPAPHFGADGPDGASHWAALAALVGATVTGAACSLLYRPYLQRYAALPTSALAMFASVVFLAGLCAATGQSMFPMLTTFQWSNVGFIGLSSGIGYFCWLWALGKLDASRVVAFQALGPVTAAAIQLVLARQWPSWSLCLSIALVATGLNIALRERRARRAAPGLG
ncbi:MAG: DMT family transporter [Pandoraea sp.]|nr:MAG: DMT family transporter [Pandoraea sp.]TAM17534.1 MAG: DMT family transporter [Pandoraea sp.]